MSTRGSGRGRPPKFPGPRRPVTFTLPERTLRGLASIDRDRARAIVKVTDAALGTYPDSGARVELIDVGPGTSLIVVGYSRYLARIPWLGLIELAPGRFILTVAAGTPVESLEVALSDVLEEIPAQDAVDRATLDELRHVLRRFRRRRGVSKVEVLVLETADAPRLPDPADRPPVR
jgi:hypothetical protein